MNAKSISLAPFKPGSFGIAFFSRGRGRGHAVPDAAIHQELLALVPDLDTRFVSYSLGAETLRSFGCDVIDLGMPDDPPFLDMLITASHILGQLRPQLVIAHEEFAAAPASEICEVPCIFITDFFQDPNSLWMHAIQYATEIIFTAESGLFTEPPMLRDKIQYVGPAIRNFEYRRADRARARRELRLPRDATVILFQSGSWRESQIPIADLLANTWAKLPYQEKHLIWLGWHDYEMLSARFRGRHDITILKEDWQIDRLIAASELVITKANRLTVYEAASFGVPSISLSNGANWPDDVAVARVSSNTHCRAQHISPSALAQIIQDRIAKGCIEESAVPKWHGVRDAARSVAARIRRMR